MPRWRKATWALVIWTVLIIVWIVAGVNAVGEAEGTGGSIGIGLTVSILSWFLGFLVLGLIWLKTHPKHNVVVYGPQGEQVTVSEKEARRRVEEQGWTHQPPTRTG